MISQQVFEKQCKQNSLINWLLSLRHREIIKQYQFVRNFFFHEKSKKQEKKAGTNFVLLSPLRNVIQQFMKTYLHIPIMSISHTQKNSKMFNMTSKYFSFFEQYTNCYLSCTNNKGFSYMLSLFELYFCAIHDTFFRNREDSPLESNRYGGHLKHKRTNHYIN